jgi:hypothetical protein
VERLAGGAGGRRARAAARRVPAARGPPGHGVVRPQPAYALPASLAGEIRARHLAAAVRDAKAAHEQIEGAIRQYRHDLVQYGRELEFMGYDLGDGPLALWTTPEQAEYTAARLNEALRQVPPDMQLVELYTQGLSAVAGGVYGDALNPSAEALRDLTAAERDFLLTFFGALDRDALVALGEVDGFSTAKADVANGITLLLDPEAGGLRDAAEVPGVLRHFLHDYRESDLFESPMGDGFRAELGRFNAFGDLMSHAVIPPGDDLARRLAGMAIDIEQRSALQPAYLLPDDLVRNTASSGLLTAVSRNTGVSAGLLNEEEFRDSLFAQWWDDSTGAADLIRAGTTVPAGMDPHADAAEPYVRAAYHVLRSAAEHTDVVLGEGATATGALATEHGALQQAVGDTVLTYLDMVSKGAATSSYDAAGPGELSDRNLHGRDHRYSFELSADEREGLLRLMNDSEAPVRRAFFDGVSAWETATAYEAFGRAAEGSRESAAFEDIGRVAGLVEKVQKVEPAQDSSKYQFTSYGAISTSASVANTLIDFGKGNAATSLAAFGLTETLRYTLPDGSSDVKEAMYNAHNYGDRTVRTAVAQAALASDYGGVSSREKLTISDEDASGVRPEDIHREALAIEESYGRFATVLVQAYDDAVYDDATAN